MVRAWQKKDYTSWFESDMGDTNDSVGKYFKAMKKMKLLPVRCICGHDLFRLVKHAKYARTTCKNCGRQHKITKAKWREYSVVMEGL